VALGVALLDEPLYASLLIGTALIIGGAALTNAGIGLRRHAPEPPAPHRTAAARTAPE
jgi:hypothetical protein